MKLDKLEAWLARDRPRAAAIRILALQVGTDPNQVQSWTLAELFAHSNRAAQVLDVCTDYADSKGESVQFRIEVLDHDERVITCTHHRASPTDDDLAPGALDADRVSTNSLIAQFMKHDENRERLLISSMDAFFKSCANIVSMQGKIIDAQQQTIMIQQTQLAEARAAGLVGRELTDEEKHEVIARASAWERAAELGPVVLQALAEKWINGKGGGDAGHANGAAA